MSNSAKELVNGDSGNSKVISHLTSYPAVSDGIDTFKSHPYGKKSLEIVDSAYTRFAKPVEPYLETPYSYAKPLVSKADEFGDRALSSVDGHFPIVKEKTDTIIEKAKSTAFWPYTYLNETWSDEYNKTAGHNSRGKGITTSVLALVSLELRVTSDFFHYVADNLRPAYEEGKKKADSAASAALDKASEYERYGKEKYADLKGTAQQKAGEVQDKAGEVQQKANNTASSAADKASDLKDGAQQKGNEIWQSTSDATSTAAKKADEAKNTAYKKTDEAKHEAHKKVQK